MSKPFVSVIMNCYNSETFLREALDCVLAQTFADWEVVFWDNQSTDGSAAIFKAYSDSRFNYYRAPQHTGLGDARNLAVEKARGAWLAFLDCDDLWVPEKLEKQVKMIREEGGDLGLVYGRCKSLIEASGQESDMARRMSEYDQRKASAPLPEGDIFLPLFKENFVPFLSCMVRRSVYWEVGGINACYRQAEDYDLVMKVAKDYRARAEQDVVCHYRIHAANLTHAQMEANYRESIDIVRQYLPLPEAAAALKRYQTYCAVQEIKQGRIASGMYRLCRHGDVVWCFGKGFGAINRRLFSDGI